MYTSVVGAEREEKRNAAHAELQSQRASVSCLSSSRPTESPTRGRTRAAMLMATIPSLRMPRGIHTISATIPPGLKTVGQVSRVGGGGRRAAHEESRGGRCVVTTAKREGRRELGLPTLRPPGR